MENFRVGVMDGLGLSYETLHARNPRLVYGAIRGFGDPRTGASPYAEWPAFDVVAQAMGGAVSATGTADGEMVRVGPSIGDLYPATVAVVGVLAAVMHARQTGEGQFVDVAMVDALVALDEALIYRYSYTGMVTAPDRQQPSAADAVRHLPDRRRRLRHRRAHREPLGTAVPAHAARGSPHRRAHPHQPRAGGQRRVRAGADGGVDERPHDGRDRRLPRRGRCRSGR